MRTALVAAVMIALVAGCSDTGSLPTEPARVSTTEPWTRIYPELPLATLNAAWGLDIDDMWIVGYGGTILHWNGRRLTWHERLTGARLTDIEGCARDDIWAVSQPGEVLHWDGRRWSLEQLDHFGDLVCLHSAGPGEVYLGGWDETEQALIVRRQGARWRTMPFADEVEGWIHHIWRPGPDRPLMAATDDVLLRWDGHAWQRVDQFARVRDADGDLVLAELDPQSSRRSLCRVDADGHLVQVCSANHVARGIDVADTEPVIIHLGFDISWLDDCITREFYDGSWYRINDLAAPVLGGPSTLAVGESGLLKLMTWTGQAMVVEDLISPLQDIPASCLTGTADELYAVGQNHTLLHLDANRFTPIITPIDGSVVQLRVLDHGELAIWNSQTIAVCDTTGYWTTLPVAPEFIYRLWIDATLEPRLLTDYGRLFGLVAGAWTLLGEVDHEGWWFHLNGFAAFGPDEIYFTVWENLAYRFLAWDGTSWQDCDLAPGHEIVDIMAGPLTGSIYFRSRDSQDQLVCGSIRDGAVTIYSSEMVFLDEIIEVTEDLVFARDDDTLYQLGPAGWVPIDHPGAARYRSLWGHPDRGLYLLTDTHEILHRPLPEGRP